MSTYAWQAIADEFLDYLGALSVETPDLDTAEARAVLKDASEAAAGAVAYAAYHPHCGFQVFLDYVNFGMSYDRGEDAPRRASRPGSGPTRSASRSSGTGPPGTGRRSASPGQVRRTDPGHPVGELATGLMAVVLDDTGDEKDYPPSAAAKLAAVDAALDRVRARAEQTGEPLPARPGGAALHALRALAAEDREAFDTALADLLTRHAALHSASATPGSLLPLVPWPSPPSRTGRWAGRPLSAPTTSRTPWSPASRPGAAGRRTRPDRRPDAVAALAAGPLTVERPAFSWTVHLKAEALYEEHVTELLAAGGEEPHALWRLGRAMGDQERLFKWRSGVSGTVTDEQLRNVRLASQMGAALFRVARAEPGAEVEVVIDGRPLRYRAQRGEKTGPGPWHTATAFALITGSREDLAPLVLTGPTYTARTAPPSAPTARPCTPTSPVRTAKPRPSRPCARPRRPGTGAGDAAGRPAVAARGRRRGELQPGPGRRARSPPRHYQVADRADDPDAAVDLDALALACHARRRGWRIRVDSAYLPKGLLQAAEPF